MKYNRENVERVFVETFGTSEITPQMAIDYLREKQDFNEIVLSVDKDGLLSIKIEFLKECHYCLLSDKKEFYLQSNLSSKNSLAYSLGTAVVSTSGVFCKAEEDQEDQHKEDLEKAQGKGGG